MLERVRYYIDGQEAGVGHYMLQEVVLALFGWVPSLVGIGLRAVFYKLIMSIDGYAAIEHGVRLRRCSGIKLGRNVYLDYGVYLHAMPQGIEIGDDTFIMHNSELHVFNFRDLPHAFIKIGRRCFLGEGTVIRGQGGVTMEDAVLTGPGVQILAMQHNYADPSLPVADQGITADGIVIEEGSWIAAGAIVLDGVRIGRGAVIGANAVVTKDVPPCSVAVGAPARVIRSVEDKEKDFYAASIPTTGTKWVPFALRE